ncbi:MAG: hypothetical protein AAGU75_20545 [Bacillota bacterium]
MRGLGKDGDGVLEGVSSAGKAPVNSGKVEKDVVTSGSINHTVDPKKEKNLYHGKIGE